MRSISGFKSCTTAKSYPTLKQLKCFCCFIAQTNTIGPTLRLLSTVENLVFGGFGVRTGLQIYNLPLNPLQHKSLPTPTELNEPHSVLPCFLMETGWDHRNSGLMFTGKTPQLLGVCALFTWPPHAAVSPDVLAKGDKRGDRKQNPRPGEPCWRQTRRRSRARRPAGWGGIKHGRHGTQRCHFLEQFKLRLTEGNRSTSVHTRTIQI